MGALLALGVIYWDPAQMGWAIFVLGLSSAILKWPQVGLLAFVAVANLLPFAVVPIRVVYSFTLVDITLSVLLVSWLLRVLTREWSLEGSVLDGFLLLYLGLAVVSFVLGLTYSISPERVRLFLKSINSTLLFFSVINCVRSTETLRRVLSALLVGGLLASAAALVLLYLPAPTAERLLSSLGPLGYPTGPNVLRPIADTEILRAIGTSVDPNVLGGLLMMASALLLAQALSPSPVLDRRLLWLALAPMVAALLLTHSRSALGGFVVAASLVGVLRDRRALILLLVAAVALPFIPQAQVLLGRLQSGLAFQDRAALMRLDEYRNALNTIATYPWFGIGFGETPSIDLFLGVSSIYLLIGQEMGLVGMTAFLLVIGAAAWQIVAGLATAPSEESRGLLLSLSAPLLAAASAGLLDHYYVNIVFPHMVGLFWLYVGLAMVAVRLQTKT
ncbi:MAG: O-antigen ligase family protein [Sphingomonadaceae bacterium]